MGAEGAGAREWPATSTGQERRLFTVACTVCPVETVTLSHTEALARLGHALSDPTRARILLALREAPAIPSDLADALGVSRQVMSNQLACLRGCGLVDGIREGRNTWYRLADPHLAPALGELLQLVLAVDPDCCCTEGCACS